MKFEITGVFGYLGREVLYRLKLLGLDVIGMDKGDELKEADVIIHLASNIYGTKREDFADEIALSMNVIKKARRKIIFTSSSAVYGNTKKPCVEDQKLKPINEYGRTKAFIEAMIRRAFDKQYSILRLGNVYDRMATHGFMANIMSGTNTLYDHGERIRDYVHLHDVVNVIVEAAVSDKWNGIYNIATGKGTSAKDLFSRLSRRKPKFKPKEEIEESILDIRKAKGKGFDPFTL